jgi:type II secretory pathway component PulL
MMRETWHHREHDMKVQKSAVRRFVMYFALFFLVWLLLNQIIHSVRLERQQRLRAIGFYDDGVPANSKAFDKTPESFSFYLDLPGKASK